ncbi:MAG: hypothetical protein H7A36_04900 [Chlamydiales bacterium]|nr:hypothetical protein [Chlamydiales bacterium]
MVLGAFCASVRGYNPCELRHPESKQDYEANIRNARVQGAALAALATLAILTTVFGALGFSGHLSQGAQLFAKNALWVTLAGSLTVALMLITWAGCSYAGKCSNRQAHEAASGHPTLVVLGDDETGSLNDFSGYSPRDGSGQEDALASSPSLTQYNPTAMHSTGANPFESNFREGHPHKDAAKA